MISISPRYRRISAVWKTRDICNARLEGRNRVYSPKVRPQTVIRETVGEMVDLLFGGETMPLMKHLVEERKFSADEIDQLRQLLDQREGGCDAK